MKYGDLPTSLGIHMVECKEMMFYQYLPIKLAGGTEIKTEPRLSCFNDIIGIIGCDFIGKNGLDEFVASYIYLTAKHMFQLPDCSFNRPGYHSDGFMTDDINYIWCDSYPTVFNKSPYALTMHHEISLDEMSMQSLKENEVAYSSLELLRLNQFNIHRVADIEKPGMRTFLKISFSRDIYNLIGNSHNHLLDYKWEMKDRSSERNHPSK